jgi:hypothetical protein
MTNEPRGADDNPNDSSSFDFSDGGGGDPSENPAASNDDSDDPTTGGWIWNKFTTESDQQTTQSNRSESGGPEQTNSKAAPQSTDDLRSNISVLSEECKQAIDSTRSFSETTLESQVLIRSPADHEVTNAVFERSLTAPDPAGRNILFIIAADTIDQQRSVLQSVADWTNGKTAVVVIGNGPDDLSVDIEQHVDIYKQISSPTKLAKLGVVVTHITSQWAQNQYPTVLGLYTLTSLQNYVDNETVCEFLYTLRGQLESSKTTSYVHMNLFGHEDHEIETISSVFDVTLEILPGGSVSIN